MKRCIWLVAVGVVLLTPAAGAAKGPSAARITGPGLEQAIVLRGFGESGDGSPLSVLTMKGGFFEVMFGPSPGRRPPVPKSELGPRYEVLYAVPTGRIHDHIRQSLFPYAAGGPVLYTPAGQRFFGVSRTVGGWFQGGTRLKAALVRAGLQPAAPRVLARPAPTPRREANGAELALAAGALALAAALAVAMLIRRKLRREPASAV
jgi:hypothetical protein